MVHPGRTPRYATRYESGRSKLRNVRSPGAWGRMYDSKAEAAYSWSLYARVQAREIAAVRCQVTLPCSANGHLICRRKVDFWVTFTDGRVEVHEVKGVATEAYKVRQKAFEATWLHEHPEVKFVLIQV